MDLNLIIKLHLLQIANASILIPHHNHIAGIFGQATTNLNSN